MINDVDGVVEKRMTVMPAQAVKWLERNKSNRKLRSAYVRRLAEDMRRGFFFYTGDPLKFDRDGWLLDGQHRLSALVEANITLDFMVVSNLPSVVYSVIDSGMPRSMADRAKIPARLVAAYNVMLNVGRSSGRMGSETRKSVHDIKMLHERLQERFGPVAQRVLDFAGSNRPFWGSAAIRAAAVVSIATGEEESYVLPLYRSMVSDKFERYHGEPPVAEVLRRKLEFHKGEMYGVQAGGANTQTQVFVWGMYLFDHNNAEVHRAKLEAKREQYVFSCKHLMADILGTIISPTGNEIVIEPMKLMEPYEY